MFIRRIGFLYVLTLLVVAVLTLQLGRLTLAEGEQRRADAEARLDQRTFLATYRGRILDRNGRVLAVDRPAYDLAVEYEVLSGAWAAHQAATAARREAGATAWSAMDPDQRGRAIQDKLPIYEAEVERLMRAICDLGGLSRAELDQRIDEIKRRVHTRAVAVWDRQREIEANRLGDDSTFTARPIREQRQPHVVLTRIPDAVAFEFSRLADELPGTIEVQESTRREYPMLDLEVTVDRSSFPRAIRNSEPVTLLLHGVADHLLGEMRDEVYASDIARRPFLDARGRLVDLGGYRPVNDRVGAWGIERSYEDRLRGVRGVEEVRLDTGTTRRTEPKPGEDVQLTIDINLQARVQALLTPAAGLAKVHQFHRGWRGDGTPRQGPLPLGWELNAAAVVIEVDTGEILALVSKPTIADGRAMTEARRLIDEPFVHRAVEAQYPPGSILKPLVYVAAVSEGVHGLHSAITCDGHYFPNNQSICRCWIYREHFGYTTHSIQVGGPLNVVQALARSCNIYFYTVADRLGARRLVEWLGRFGLGRVLDTGLLTTIVDGEGERRVGEGAGSIPSEKDIVALEQDRARSTTVMMGIGQGPITWTPLQAANAYATLARGGVLLDATVARSHDRSVNSDRSGDLQLNPHAVSLALKGLRESIEENYGTGNHITAADGTREPIVDVPGVIVWAKTGTAQAPSRRFDTDGDGEGDAEIEGLDHAWFVGLAGSKREGRPRYAIAVVVEYGGSGGRVAGPIAAQIIKSLQDLGYLEHEPGGDREDGRRPRRRAG